MTDKNWLDLFLDYTDNTESPRSFRFWAGVSSIVAALQRKVWINFGHKDNPFTQYVNMFVVFVAPPGRCRKTQAIRYALPILAELENVALSSDAVTREALIKELVSTHRTDILDTESNEIIDHCSLTCIAEEFSVFLGQNNFNLISLLLTLYDCKDVWTYNTKNAGRDQINGLWFSMLGATTPQLLINCIPREAIGGGLTSRILFIVEDQRPKRVTSPYLPPEIKEELVARLKIINKIKGEIEFTKEAYTVYDHWYQTAPEGHTEFDERSHVYTLKLAMCVAAGAGRNYIIPEDITRSIAELDSIKDRMAEAYLGAGRSPLGYCISKIKAALHNIPDGEALDLGKFLLENEYDITPFDIQQTIQLLSQTKEAHYAQSSDQQLLFKGPPPAILSIGDGDSNDETSSG